MKTKASKIKRARPNIAKAVCRGLLMLLAALILQGCATARTAWSRQHQPQREAMTLPERHVTTGESNPVTALLTFSF